MKLRILISLVLAAVVTSVGAIPAPLTPHSSMQQLETATTPMLPGTTIPLKVVAGNQTNPSVACNIASYTNDDLEGTSSIRYVDFASNTEHVVPGNGLDRLSETDGQRIVFTEIGPTGDHIGLYDISSQTTTFIAGSGSSDPALGGNLVAFRVRQSLNDGGEIQIYDRSTGGYAVLSFNDLQDWKPAVSPDGNVVVWETCQLNGTDCDVYSSTKSSDGAFFNTRVRTGVGNDTSPDTNGQVIVYISDKSGENDIYLQQVDGSTEMHLSISGDQRDPRISGNLLVFESQVSDRSYDVFLYDLATARLYQVTNTPGQDETLSDVAAGCNGVNRIVYALPGAGAFDVWGFNFQLNDSVVDQLNVLVALVQSFNLHDGIEASLITKLQDALAAINASDTATACDSLTAFINASQAQSGKKLTATQVKQLVDSASQIKIDLGCQ